MAKTKKPEATPAPSKEPVQPVAPTLSEVLRNYLPTLRNNGTLSVEGAIRMNRATFNSERYSIEFYKLIKGMQPTSPLIIIQEEGESVSELGWFDALDTGLWYNLITVPSDILESLV